MCAVYDNSITFNNKCIFYVSGVSPVVRFLCCVLAVNGLMAKLY